MTDQELIERGTGAGARLVAAQEAERTARLAADAARYAMWDAEREFALVERELRTRDCTNIIQFRELLRKKEPA